MRRILVIEDDPAIGNMLEEVLQKAGYRVTHAWSGTEAALLLANWRPDLILLDLMLPGMSGEEVLKRIKGVPVIVLSAKAEVEHKVALLLGGVSDYMTKPFDTKELLARIQVALRSHPMAEAEILTAGDLRLDTQSGMICRIVGDAEEEAPTEEEMPTVEEAPMEAGTSAEGDRLTDAGDGQRQAHLTRTECAVLKLFLQNPSQVIPRSRLLDRISQDTPDCTEGSLKMHISNLRKKLKAIGCEDRIEAVWGIGFLWNDGSKDQKKSREKM